MGTPGDKGKVREVVRRISAAQVNPEKGDEPPAKPSTASESLGELPTESSATGMTVISRLPQFGSFVDYSSSQSLPQSGGEKVETVTLEQARIEDYYGQTKFYPSSADVLQTPTKSEKTFLSLAEPGPSGLQISKTKPVAKLHLKKSKKPQTSQTAKKNFVCPVCQKSFQNRANLAKHQISHNGNSPHKCEHCKKTFSSKFKLVRHVLIHSDRKPFSCSVCERTFHRKDHLKNHIKVHSPSKKHYVCEKHNCKKEYTSLISFKKHTALHAAEEGSLECQICSKTFETKDEILYHLKIHAGSRAVKNPNEKKFTCDHCDRKFFTRKDVRRHLVVHTGMRDFLCQFCPQRFGRKDHLVRHIKKSHSKNLPLEAQTIKIEIPEFSIKSEPSESSISNPERYEASPVDFPVSTKIEKIDITDIEVGSLFFPQGFTELNPILPSTSEQLQFLPGPSSQSELKDLGSGVLEEIETSPPSELIEERSAGPLNPQLLEEPVLSDTEIMRLLQTTEDKNLPLPGFSQTFQSQPPPPPPPQ
ncbi:zinc finger protein PLAG1-like [Photinus pyralis]|nr:zinc finger protein PLAG1-like [Photinus pyralis]XP_031327520.1 zinc finger protein PLAG1-like [Photinus pyralis]